MAFIIGLFEKIGVLFLAYLAKQIWASVSNWAMKIIAWVAFKKKTEKESTESAQPLKDAKTGEEIDKSTDSTLGDL